MDEVVDFSIPQNDATNIGMDISYEAESQGGGF